MPRVTIFGHNVRCQPVLNYIGAQETLAFCCAKGADIQLRGPRAVAAWERERLGYARQRNAHEAKLRPEERAAVQAYNVSPEDVRAAAWAVLCDPPTKEHK